MTTAEYRDALEALGLTQVEAARLMGADARTGRRWALGEVRIPGSVALLLRLWQRRPEMLDVCRQIAEEVDTCAAVS